ncbi:MAG: rhomboid family intramembrane serine protease [Myxococcota bacterium]
MKIAAGGQSADLVDGGEWWRLATSAFVHADLAHVLFNGLGLWALGQLLEPRVGGRRLWSWFAIGAVGASVASHLAGISQSDGASGGAFAWMGAAVALGWRWRRRFHDDAWLLGPGLWLVAIGNLVLSVVVPRIDAVAHAAGLGLGLILGALCREDRPALGVVAGAFLFVCLWGWTVGLP